MAKKVKPPDHTQTIMVDANWDGTLCEICVTPWRARVHSNPAKGPNKLKWELVDPVDKEIEIEFARDSQKKPKSPFLGDGFTTGNAKGNPGKSQKETKSVTTEVAVKGKKAGGYHYNITVFFGGANPMTLFIDPEYEYDDDEEEQEDE